MRSPRVRSKTFADGSGGSIISVPVHQQYFEMVSSAAFSVERILSQRLSNMAPVDAAAITAQLEKAIEEVRAKEEERTDAIKGSGGTSETQTETAGANGTEDSAGPLESAGAMSEKRQVMKGLWGLRLAQSPNQALVELDLAVLKPKLDECVIRAKL